MRFARLLVTAHDEHWLDAAVREFTGYSSSIISCDSETGLERRLSSDETPDGRPGAAILVFGFSSDALATVVPNRAGQCLMTCPTTAVYDGLSAGEARIPLGKTIRFFGDGFQKSKRVGGRRFWRVPVMDGEFLIEHMVYIDKGVGGGNIILQGDTQLATLAAVRRAIAAIDAGFTRAFVTIADSQLTTLACALVMFWLGAGPIRGFAVTLTVGICTSIFAAVTVVRLLIFYWLNSVRGARGPIALPV